MPGDDLASVAERAASILVRRQHGVITRRQRIRATTLLTVGGLLVGGILWLPEPTSDLEGPALPPAVDTITEDQWAAQTTFVIATLTRQIDDLTRAQADWTAQPAPLRNPQPDAVLLLNRRLDLLAKQRLVLTSQRHSAADLHSLGLDLTALIHEGARLDHAITQTPHTRDLTPAQAADLERLRHLLRSNTARQTAKRAELDQLRADVRTAMRTPLPDPDPTVTSTLTASVRDYIDHPERPRAPGQRPGNALSSRRDSTEPREMTSPTRREVHIGAPPRPGRETEPNHSDDAQPAPTGSGYRVRHGDTLWNLAAEHLCDPTRWTEIYELNRARPQADGEHLGDPALIRPGWILHFPVAPNRPHTRGNPR